MADVRFLKIPWGCLRLLRTTVFQIRASMHFRDELLLWFFLFGLSCQILRFDSPFEYNFFCSFLLLQMQHFEKSHSFSISWQKLLKCERLPSTNLVKEPYQLYIYHSRGVTTSLKLRGKPKNWGGRTLRMIWLLTFKVKFQGK